MQKLLIAKEQPKFTEKEAIEFLKARGYSVRKEKIEEDISVNNMQIVDFFYDELRKVLGAERTTLIRQDSKDLKALQRYQEKARRFNISKGNANIYLYKSIKLFFKYRSDKDVKEELRDITPYNISFLLGAGAWILDKITEIHQNRLKEYEYSDEGEAFKNKIYEEEDDLFLRLQAERHSKILNNR